MYYYIVNPAAGNSQLNSIQEKLKTKLSKHGIEGEFVKTIGPGDAGKLVQQALERNVKTIVAVGGNETVNEVLQTLYARQHTDVALGIIPIGKTNTLANQLGLKTWQHACQVIANRHLTHLNLLAANDEVFVYRFVLQNIVTPADETEEARPRPFTVTAKTDDDLHIKAKVLEVEVTNQKINDISLDNKLLIKLREGEPEPGQPSKLRRWLPWLRRAAAAPHSQFNAHALHVRAGHPVTAVLDGQEMSESEFAVSLTDRHITLITARDKPR